MTRIPTGTYTSTPLVVVRHRVTLKLTDAAMRGLHIGCERAGCAHLGDYLMQILNDQGRRDLRQHRDDFNAAHPELSQIGTKGADQFDEEDLR